MWLGVRNHSVGSTGAADSWVGRCRTWASGMLVGRGSYVVSGGNVFKCAIAEGTVATSTTTPAVGTGADSVAWTLARAATTEDTDRRIYANGSALFDPNGYLAGCAASIASAVGWDSIISCISIGQSDRTLSVSRAEYAAALRNASAYLLAAGATKVAIGFTCTGNEVGLTSWYDSDLVPGRADALAALAGDPRVIAGANLYAVMPSLPTIPADKTTPGLKSDNLHLNNAALAIGSQAWRDALHAAGW